LGDVAGEDREDARFVDAGDRVLAGFHHLG
jgi:hypothetical protein